MPEIGTSEWAATLFAARDIRLHTDGFCSCNSQLICDRAPRPLRYKRYQIDGGRHRGNTEKTYESYGRVT